MLIFQMKCSKRTCIILYENDKFYIADNFANGVYRKGSCTRIELKQAVENLSEHEYWYNGYRGTIEMLSYNPEKRAVFEQYRIKESIQDYLRIF